MKKNYILLLVLAICWFTIGTLNAQKRVLEEGFDTTVAGALPDNWTQEPSSETSKWVVETSDLINPSATYSGVGRAKIKFPESGGESAVKLITPMMIISDLEKPILTFSYASVRLGSEADSLKVYYRNRSMGAWTLIKSYGESESYTRDTIEFSRAQYLQIAFEAVNKECRGVVLDDVVVTSRAVAETPHSVAAYNVIHNHAKLRWGGSLEAKYVVILSQRKLSNPSASKPSSTLRIDTIDPGLTNHSYDDLKVSQLYYYYIQADRGYGDVSDWVSGDFETGCTPITKLDTSFERVSDIACWKMTGTSYGEHKVTLPTNMDVEVDAVGYSPTVSPEPKDGKTALQMHLLAFNETEYSKVYAITPRLADAIDLKTQQLDFWMKSNSRRLKMNVYVSEWPDDYSNAELIGSVSVKTENTYEKATVTFDNIKVDADGKHIAKYIIFHLDGYGLNLRYSPQVPCVNLDLVKLRDIETCSAETRISLFNAPVFDGDNAALLKWNGAGAASWRLKVSEQPINPISGKGTVFDEIITNPEQMITGLQPSSTYFYYVLPICEDDIKGIWSNEQSFQTPCPLDGVQVPYMENFDKYEKNTMPACWSYVTTSENQTLYVSEHNAANSAPNILYMSNWGCTTHVTTPKMAVPLNELQIKFNLSISSVEIPVTVGVMSDPNDASTFERIESFFVSRAQQYDNYNWSTKTCSFERYEGTAQYIAFKYDNNASFALDDIVIEKIPLCGSVQNITTSGAADFITLNWEPAGDESSWDILYGVEGFSVAGKTPISVDIHPYDITNLTENTAYDIYIRSSCGTNEKGTWQGPITARTNKPAVLPYFCDFEDATSAEAWVLANGTQINRWTVGEAAGDDGNGNALYISDSYGRTNHASVSETYSYAYRTLDIPAGYIDFSFKWRLNSADTEVVENCIKWNDQPPGECLEYGESTSVNSCTSVLNAYLVPADVKIEGGNGYGVFEITPFNGRDERGSWTKSTVPTGWIALSSDILIDGTDKWHRFSSSRQMEEGGKYNLVILWMTKYQAHNEDKMPAAIDSVLVELNTTACVTPEKMVISDVTQTSARLTFLNYNSTQWKLKISETAFASQSEIESAETNLAVNEVFSTNPHQISGLNPGTEYYAYLRAACGGNWVSASFTTVCESQGVPFYENFESYQKYQYPACWIRSEGTGSLFDATSLGTAKDAVTICYTPDLISAVKDNNPSKALYIESSGIQNRPGYSVFTEFNVDVNALYMTLKVANSYDDTTHPFKLEVGVMTNPYEYDTFETVGTIAPKIAGQWNTYSVLFDEYKGTGRYIALRVPITNNMSGGLFIDDIKIDSIQGCSPPRDIKVSNITADGAEISWREIVEGSSYLVKICSSPLARWEDKADIFETTVTGNKAEITGLSASKIYYAYVRSDCDGDGKVFSMTYLETSFRTGCPELTTLPFFEDFESYDLKATPACWTLTTNPLNSGTRISNPYNDEMGIGYKPYSGSRVVLIESSTTIDALAALPTFDVDDIKNVVLSFQGLQMGSSDVLTVGVLSDVNDASTFTKVGTIELPLYGQWMKCTVPFESYTGTGKNIAFYMSKGSMVGNAFYIDDIEIRHKDVTCPDIPSATVVRITKNSASVNWTEINEADRFQIKVASREINPEKEEGDVLATTNVSNNFYNLTALEPNTKYYVYLRSECAGASYGYWSSGFVFKTACDVVITLPYAEDFSGYGEIKAYSYFPECWKYRITTFGTISPSNQINPYIEEDETKSSLYMKAYYDKYDDAYAQIDLITPDIDMDIRNTYMTFQAKSNVPNAQLHIGALSDPSNPSTFVAYDTVWVAAANTWEKFLINFIDYPEPKENESHRNIVFRINSLDVKNIYTMQISDIEVEDLLECMPPRKVYVDNRRERAFVSWRPGDKNNKEWEWYHYETSGMPLKAPFTDAEFAAITPEPLHKVSETTSETTFTLHKDADVTASATPYYFYIKTTACDPFGFYPLQVKIDNVTCGVIDQVPYTMAFDDPEAGTQYAFPDCWERDADVKNAEEKIVYPYVEKDSTLRMSAAENAYSAAMLPKLSNKLSNTDLLLTFDAKGGNETQLEVCLFSYANGTIEDYTVIKTFDLTGEWAKYAANLTGYLQAGANLGFRLTGDETIYLDNVMLDEIPYCELPVISLVTRSANSFKIEWTKSDVQSHWYYVYDKVGFDPDTASIQTRTQTNLTLSNLQPNTAYDVYIRTYCSDTEVTTDWVKFSTTTLQTPAEYPYETATFADIADWTLANGSATNAWSLGTAATDGASASLYISNDKGTSHAYDAISATSVFAYRTIQIPDGPHTLSFDWKAGGEATADFMRVFLVPESVALNGGNSYGITDSATPQGWIAVGGAMYGKSAWSNEKFELYISHDINEPMNLVFYWTNNSTDGTGVPAAVKNVKFAVSDKCTVPERLRAGQITTSSATIDWASYNATSWNIEVYTQPKGTAGVTAKTYTSNSKSYALSGLNSDTQYWFYVQAACNAEWSEGASFRTACTAVTELEERFETMLPSCWSLYEGLASDVFADPLALVATTAGWDSTRTVVLNGAHAKLNIAGDNSGFWMVSPPVTLSESSLLSFDLALTETNSVAPILNANGQQDDRFMVLISTDEGETWSESNSVVWDNQKKGKYAFNSIANKGETIHIDLYDYRNKTVRVAFYGESITALESNDIHVDSVLIANYSKRNVYTDTACQDYMFVKYGFEVSKEQTSKPGVQTFIRTENDELHILTLTISPTVSTERVVEICSKELPYSDADFKNITKAGDYHTTKIAANNCDSVISLYLTVYEDYEIDRTLNIKVADLPFSFPSTTNPCRVFDENTVSGKYVLVCKTEFGCDSIVNLTLNVEGRTGLNDVAWSEFAMVPNPAAKGEKIIISSTFTPDELQGMKVEMFSSLGICMRILYPGDNPIVLEGLNESGLYVVQITTGTGKKLFGKVIVR